MALLGSSVDPRLFMQDYSGFTRAAEIQAQGMQNLGAAIGQGIKDFGEARQERKKLDAGIKANRKSIESALKLGESLGIDVSSLNPILEQMDDPNVTPMEAAALGQAGAQRITDTLNLGIKLQDRAAKLEQYRAENLYKQGMLEASQMRAGASVLSAQQGAKPKFEPLKPQITSPTGEVFEGPLLPYDVNRGMFFDTKAQKYIADPNLIGTGKEYAPDPAMPTPTSQVGDGAADLISGAANGTFNISYKTRDLLPASSPTNRQISLDFNAAPSKNAKGIEIIIPNNATDEERQLAQEYVAKTQQYFAERGVNVPARGVRTAKENGRGTPNRFHTEPFFVGDAASRAVMEKDPDGYAQVLASTLGRIPGAMFIPPHKSNDPGASDGKFNERDFAKGSIIPALERLSKQKSAQANPAEIDNAISMTGDMTQQAMGTPEQQAMLAQQIEQGAGMAMAQNVPQGAIPTEPSMATQQPQLPQQAAPQWSPPPGFAPVKPKGNKPTTKMTAEQVANLAAQGFKVNALPTDDGNFMVSGATVGGGSGTTFDFDPKTGRVIITQGGSKAGQTAKAEEKTKALATGLTQDLYALKDRYTALSAGTGPIPALSRLGASAVPGTPANEVSEIARRVTSGLTIEKIMSERRSNASGAALGGSTSDKDMKILESATTSLNAAQNPEAFNREWTRIMEAQLNIAYGTPEQRANLVKEGKITEQYNKQVEDLYPDETINMKGQLIPRVKTATLNVESPVSSETQAILDRYGKGQ